MIGLPIFLYTAPLACFDCRKMSELKIVSGEIEMPTYAHLGNVSKHPCNCHLSNLLYFLEQWSVAIIIFSHQKGANVRRERRLFCILLSGSLALNILFNYPMKLKKIIMQIE